MRTPRSEAKDPATRPSIQIGPETHLVIAVLIFKYIVTHTSDQDHLASVMRVRLHIRHDYGCSKVSQSRCYSAHDGDVAITSKFWNLRVVVLEHSERQWKAYDQCQSET
jgi:hypothetical protein